MTVNLKMKNQTEIFEKLVGGGSNDSTLKSFKTHVENGNIKVEVGFWAITLDFPNHSQPKIGANLPVSVTQIMKGNADPATTAICANTAVELMKAGLKAVGAGAMAEFTAGAKASEFDAELTGKPDIAPMPNPNVSVPKNVSKGASAVAKAKYDALKKNGEAVKAAAALNDPIKLRDAVDLGQAVYGTSKGSIYWTIAVSERVKIAARIVPSGVNATLSLRAEGLPNQQEQSLLLATGMSKSAEGHWSMHLECGSVPVARVVGAWLMGVGIDFDQQVTAANQLKVS